MRELWNKNRLFREADSSKHLLWISIVKTAFVASCYRGAKCGEEDNVIGMFLEDMFQSLGDMGHGGGGSRSIRLNGNNTNRFMIAISSKSF